MPLQDLTPQLRTRLRRVERLVGLFVGLAFSCIALIRRGHLLWAAMLAICAAWTRAVGVALITPLLLPWIRGGEWLDLGLEWRQPCVQGIPWRALGPALIAMWVG